MRWTRFLLAASRIMGLCAMAALTACAGIPKSTPMPLGALTLPPSGFVDFCLREQHSCVAETRDPGPVALTPARWRQLNDINVAINTKIKPETDLDQYHLVEYWTYTDKAGDCEDYALDKQRALEQAGWPSDALLLATARNEHGEMHAVLVVSTDQGDYVMDNASNFVTPWTDLPYRWVARQDKTTPLAWHRAGTAASETRTAALPPSH
jgi:predicted transglutaminase-like cysteine proteinase